MSSAKLKILERKLGLVPKQFPPMSPGMERIARQQDRQAPEPTPVTGDLGLMIEQMIAQQVEKRVSEALEQQRQFNKPAPVTDYRQLPPVQKTPARKAMEIQLQRNELGQISMVDMGDMQFRVQRNQLGEIVRLVPADIAPMPPAIKPPYKAEARKYDPGTERT